MMTMLLTRAMASMIYRAALFRPSLRRRLITPCPKEDPDGLIENGLPVEFDHNLTDLLGGQGTTGFVIIDVHEDCSFDSLLLDYHLTSMPRVKRIGDRSKICRMSWSPFVKIPTLDYLIPLQ